MNNNSNNAPARAAEAPPPFVNSGGTAQSGTVNHQQPPHLLSQSQAQTQGRVSRFPGHFQLSEPQAQLGGHSQYAQATHARIQAQVQSTNQSVYQLQNANSNNVGVSSPSASTPASTSAKRANSKPPSRPSGGSTNPNVASPFKSMELTPAALRKKRKEPENQIPDKVASILPESALYSQYLEYEARIDALMARKKMDIQAALKSPSCVRKTLRVYIFNTFENQGQGVLDKSNLDQPSWSLKIIGRILEEGKDPLLSGIAPKAYPKFSSYFKKITIYLDQSLFPDNHVILWECCRSPVLHEGFEVKRKGDKEFTARIRLEMNYVPEKFKLSPALSEVLGIEIETRPRIVVALWQYVKSRKLQNSNDPTFFMCDPSLQKVFGEEKMRFAMVSQKLEQHLTPPQPIHLEHKIKLAGNCPAGTTCYDFVVDVPFPLQKDLNSFLSKTESSKEIDDWDKIISNSIKKIHEHHRRRAFFLSFSQSPADFINALIASQSKDLKLVAGEASRGAEKERQSEFYNQPWVEDAVIRYLNRKAAGSDAPGSN